MSQAKQIHLRLCRGRPPLPLPLPLDMKWLDLCTVPRSGEQSSQHQGTSSSSSISEFCLMNLMADFDCTRYLAFCCLKPCPNLIVLRNATGWWGVPEGEEQQRSVQGTQRSINSSARNKPFNLSKLLLNIARIYRRGCKVFCIEYTIQKVDYRAQKSAMYLVGYLLKIQAISEISASERRVQSKKKILYVIPTILVIETLLLDWEVRIGVVELRMT